MLPHALVCYPDGTFSEYFYSAVSRVYRTTTYASLEELLSHSDYRLEEMLSLCAAYPSWVFAMGLSWDHIFIGHNAEGNILLHDNYRPRVNHFFNIAQGGFLPANHLPFKNYGQILDAPSWLYVAPDLINLGILPDLPRYTVLDPVLAQDGTEYWSLIWN